MLHAPDHAASSSACSCPCPTCSGSPPHSAADHPLDRVVRELEAERDPLTSDLAAELAGFPTAANARAMLLEGVAAFGDPSPAAQLRALRSAVADELAGEPAETPYGRLGRAFGEAVTPAERLRARRDVAGDDDDDPELVKRAMDGDR